MKTKFMALMLAVGLGVTGVTMIAQASEAACTHSRATGRILSTTVHDFNGNYHYVTYEIDIDYCPDCGQHVGVVSEYRIESHDYEQTYYDNGSVLSECTVCGYSYYW